MQAAPAQQEGKLISTHENSVGLLRREAQGGGLAGIASTNGGIFRGGKAMDDSVPITPEVLAVKTGCNTRLIREWLSKDKRVASLRQQPISAP
jgi:hypothetical protein